MVLVSTARNGSSSRMRARVLQEQAREQHALELAARQRADHAIGEVVQAERGERLRPPPACACASIPRQMPISRHSPMATQSNTVIGEAAVDVDLLRQIGDVAPVEPVRGRSSRRAGA